MLRVCVAEFGLDSELVADTVEIRRGGGGASAVEQLWGLIYADDAGIVSRSSTGLEKMMLIIVGAAGSFGLMVSEPKTEIMCLLPRRMEKCQFTIKAAGQRYKQTDKFVYLGATMCESRKVDAELSNRIGQAWACYTRNGESVYDRRELTIELKARPLKAEVVETLLYGCTTWGMSLANYNILNGAHRKFLTRIIGWRKHKRTGRPLPYAEALIRAGCAETIEATARKRRLLFGGLVVRMGD